MAAPEKNSSGSVEPRSPLDGVVILDLTRVLAGPYCTMILGDMGAEVIKVEPPGKGDDTRAWGPPFVDGESAYFLNINRNKKSITLNLKSEKGKEILRGLAKKADVLVENFRPGTMDDLGFSYESLSDLNPRLVYCGMSGFGRTGPQRERPGYDIVVQGESGLMSITGFPDGMPLRVGVAISDIVTGMFAVQGILLALFAREKTGKGQLVDISMLDSQVACLTYQAGIYYATGISPQRLGNRHPTIVPYETYQTNDGYVNIAVGNETLWAKFCDALDLGWLKDKEEFKTNSKRVQNYPILNEILVKELLKRSSTEIVEALSRAGVPCGSIKDLDAVFKDEQVVHRGMLKIVDHPKLGKIRTTGTPLKLSASGETPSLPPPLLGQHTEEILHKFLGYTEETIDSLRKAGAV
ncbi:MAG: CoA transferase [Candidatus Eisenbacteria bacterium]|nr:CoA transferase [Candidatus Eisenbacteria bacterium]